MRQPERNAPSPSYYHGDCLFALFRCFFFFRCEGCGDGNELLPVLSISVVWFFMACMRKSQGKLYQLIRCTCSIDSTGAWWGETRPSGASRLPFRWPDQPRFRQRSYNPPASLWRQMWRCASPSSLLPPPLQGTYSYCGPTWSREAGCVGPVFA